MASIHDVKKRCGGTSVGHSLCHSGDAIRGWSGNHQVDASHSLWIPLPFLFPQNSFNGVGRSEITEQRFFGQNDIFNNNPGETILFVRVST